MGCLDTLRPCVVAMEAYGGAHHIGRLCLQNGREPRLMSPLHVGRHVDGVRIASAYQAN